MRFQSGITDQYIYFVAVDSTDLKTRETGLSSFTVYRSRNGAAAAAFTTPTINETDVTNMPGVYELLLDEDMTIDSGNDSEAVVLHITQASMAPVTLMYELYRPVVSVGQTLTLATGNASANVLFWDNSAVATPTVAGVPEVEVTHWAGNAVPATTLSGRPLVDLSAWLGAVPNALTSNRVDVSVGAMAAGTVTAAAIATGAIDADAVAADAVTEIQFGLATAASIAALNNISAAQVNTEVVDALANDLYGEPAQGAPGVSLSLANKINYLYKAWRNKKTQTSTTWSLFADDATTVDQKATVSDDATTATVGEIATGP